jgi:hypothetical protein
LIPVRGAVPVLLRVRVCVGLLVPVITFPKARDVGVTLAIGAAVKPVPVSCTAEPVTVALLPVMVTVPVAAPAAVGEKRTLMVQVAATVRVPPQDPPARTKGAVTTTLMPVKVAVPVLLRVRVCEALLVPVATFPKARDVGVTLTIGAAAGPVYSTAPMSTLRPCGLTVPKKSWFGAPVLLPVSTAVDPVFSA